MTIPQKVYFFHLPSVKTENHLSLNFSIISLQYLPPTNLTVHTAEPHISPYSYSSSPSVTVASALFSTVAIWTTYDSFHSRHAQVPTPVFLQCPTISPVLRPMLTHMLPSVVDVLTLPQPSYLFSRLLSTMNPIMTLLLLLCTTVACVSSMLPIRHKSSRSVLSW